MPEVTIEMGKTMRTWILAGIYLAPVATFATISGMSGYVHELVEHSDTTGNTVLAEILDIDDAYIVETSTEAETPTGVPEIETAVATQGSRHWVSGDAAASRWMENAENPAAFDDLSFASILAEFDALTPASLNLGDATNSFSVTANSTPYGGFAAGGSGGGSSAATGTAFGALSNVPNPYFKGSGSSGIAKANFGGFGSSGSANSPVSSNVGAVAVAVGTAAVTGTATGTATAGTSGGTTAVSTTVTPGSTAPTTAALAAVPLPAGAPLLAAGLLAFGLLGRRKNT